MINRVLILIFMFCSVAFSVFSGNNISIESVIYAPKIIDATTGITINPVLTDGPADVTFEYRWFLNGEEVLQEITDHFPGTQLKRGDQLSIEIIPVLHGGERLPPFISRPFEVGNAKPAITSDPSSASTSNGFSYQVTATDPDGDSLVFSLEQGPDGMTIDAATGNIDWILNAAPEGAFPVRIVVDDGYKGQAVQAFELVLSNDSK